MVVISEGQTVAAGSVPELSARLDLRPHLGRFEAGAVLEATVAEQEPRVWLDAPAVRRRCTLCARRGRADRRAAARSHPGARRVPRPFCAARRKLPECAAGDRLGDREAKGASLDVAVAVGATTIVARITRKSVDALALAPGKPVFALVKSVAIDRHSVGYS